MQYASISDAIAIINTYGKCFMAKSDIAEAYRLVPMHPSCYNLLGFKLREEYYYDRCLPMGACSACKIFERFSSALLFILTSVYKVKHVVKLLDDFLFIGETEQQCLYALNSFKSLCALIKVPLAIKKTVEPSLNVTFLGINLDTVSGTASIPVEKINSYAVSLSKLLVRDECTLRELKSMIGKLQFTCCIITTGRCFLRRLHDKTVGKTSPSSKIILDDETKEDLKTWQLFLAKYNGRSLLAFSNVCSSSELHMFSDSSKSGYGATFGKKFLYGEFPKSWATLDIQVLELYPIFLLILIFASNLSNNHVIFHCDNIAIVHSINNQTSRNKCVMKLLRPMLLVLLKNNILFRAIHIPGVKNILCDSLSRQQVSGPLLHKFGMDPSPVPIPSKLRPPNLGLL